MGADIYLKSVQEKEYAFWEPQFKEAATLRDRLPVGSPEREVAQALVSELYDKMYGKGYFRDSYNASNFINKLDLSWWRDVKTDDEGMLPIEQAQWLLDEVYRRFKEVFPEEFNQFCSENNAEWGLEAEAERQGWLEFFHLKFEQLTSILRASIELNEPLYCSL